MPKIIRIKRILSHEEAQKEAKETCPHGMSYLLSCHQCDRYDYCSLLWKFEESEVKHDGITTTTKVEYPNIVNEEIEIHEKVICLRK